MKRKSFGVSALAIALGMSACLTGCGKNTEEKTEEKIDVPEAETPADKIANSENVIEDSRDMLFYAVTGEADEEGKYDCMIEQGGKTTQWTDELAQEMMYIQSGTKITTGSSMLANMSIGMSLIEMGIEGDSEVEFTETEGKDDTFNVTADLSSGGITLGMRETEDIERMTIETDDTDVTFTPGSAGRVSYQAGKVSVSVLRGEATIEYDDKEVTVEEGKTVVVDEAAETVGDPADIDFNSFTIEGLTQTISLGSYTIQFNEDLLSKANSTLLEKMGVSEEDLLQQ